VAAALDSPSPLSSALTVIAVDPVRSDAARLGVSITRVL